LKASGKNSFEGRTWPSNSPFLRVDYVWLSKNDWQVQKGSGKLLGNTTYSDHLGLKITVNKK
jgi:endonuclease/exonuclease/phosphatase family metal-dependent hydrolase